MCVVLTWSRVVEGAETARFFAKRKTKNVFLVGDRAFARSRVRVGYVACDVSIALSHPRRRLGRCVRGVRVGQNTAFVSEVGVENALDPPAVVVDRAEQPLG